MSGLDVDRWRERFHLDGRVHLDACSVPPRHDAADAAREAYERAWRAGDAWASWERAVDDARVRFADLVGADAENVAVLSSVSHALAQVAGSLPWDAGDEVVVGDAEFRTVPQFWTAFAERHGLRVRVAGSEGGRVPVSAYESVMSDRTRVVCTAHVSPVTGGRVDAAALADAAHDRDALVVLDAYQSAGALELDVDALGVDCLLAGARKFCLGAPGVAFCALGDGVAERLSPSTPGWTAFEGDDLRTGARRLEAGTPPATAAAESAAGLSVLADVGRGRVADRIAHLTSRLVDGADRRGVDVVTPADPRARGPLVVLGVDDPDRVVAALRERDVLVTARGGVRVAPHFFNTASEVDRALDALDAVTA